MISYTYHRHNLMIIVVNKYLSILPYSSANIWALVIVNGKWHARLNHYDYEGPRELLRKGSEFRAVGEGLLLEAL